jgi:hypothetical protein|nr:MAG TPA: hypothetical protein [Caudoviricetes sp.]
MTVMNGAREIKIVLFIRKLIKEHKKYINYRISDEGFIVFMVFNYYYEVMKRIHPKAQVWQLKNTFDVCTVMRHKKIKYKLSKEDKRCILIAFHLFNRIEYNKTLVDNVIANLFKLREYH